MSRSSLAETSWICIVLVPSALYAMSVWIGDDWYKIDTVLGDCRRFFGLVKDWNAVGALVVRW